MVVFLGSQPVLWGLELLHVEGRGSIPWPCFWIRSIGVREGLRGSITAAAETPWSHQQKQLLEMSWLWQVAVPKHDAVGSAERYARSGLAWSQLWLWLPEETMQKGREEGKVPFEKWQRQRESSEGEAY